MEKAKKFMSNALVIVAALIGVALAKGFVGAMMAPDEHSSLLRATKMAAEQINAQGPQRLDDVTTMTGAAARGTRLVYFYMIDGRKSDFSTTVAENLEAQVIRDVCAHEQMRKSMRSGAEFEYLYKDETGVVIVNFAIARSTCGI
jgi:uncharacterized protein (UPF0333 family)